MNYRFPDGSEVHEFADATIDVASDGKKIQTNPDGSILVTYPNGKKQFTSITGEVKDIE